MTGPRRNSSQERREGTVPQRFLSSLLMVASLCLGCGMKAGSSPEMRLPDPDVARAALEAALDTWKADRQVTGKTIGANPAIGVVDTLQAERPLLDYEILGALGALPEARPFAVRLVLGSPREEVATRYMVLGENPLWVFRQEDYELILHWEHKMTDDELEGLSGQSSPPPVSTVEEQE